MAHTAMNRPRAGRAARPEAGHSPAGHSAAAKPKTGSSARRSARKAGGDFQGADFGPGIRRRPIRDKAGAVLREADVELDDGAVDPRYPNRRLRRAYRVDPADALLRAGSIGRRELDAISELRRCLERVTPSLGCAGNPARIAVSASSVEPISDAQIRAAQRIREAGDALGAHLWPPVLWVCLGGSVKGFAAEWRIRAATASELVGTGMQRLAEHFYGRP